MMLSFVSGLVIGIIVGVLTILAWAMSNDGGME
jgi:hypothetical protein